MSQSVTITEPEVSIEYVMVHVPDKWSPICQIRVNGSYFGDLYDREGNISNIGLGYVGIGKCGAVRTSKDQITTLIDTLAYAFAVRRAFVHAQELARWS